MKQQSRDAQPPLSAEMVRPTFGGIQYKPMNTGKGGWDLFRPHTGPEPASQATLDELLELGYLASEYGEAAEEIDHE